MTPREFSVLIVDDDPMLLEVLRIQLEHYLPSHVFIERAGDGEEGLDVMRELAKSNINPVKIIISDYFMPGMTGTEFLLRAHVIAPNSKKILLTGQADEETVQQLLKESELFHFMTKPWNSSDMESVVKGFIDQLDQFQSN